MLTILFWNFPCRVEGERAEALAALARMAHFHRVDILVLAETRASPGEVLNALNVGSMTYELAEVPPDPRPRIWFFTQAPGIELPPYRNDGRMDIRRLRWAGRREVLLAAVHFHDRRNNSPEDQAVKAPGVYRTLRDAEIDRDHTRTILFGDLNMNSFEAGMVNTEGGFASMPSRSLAIRHSSPIVPGPQRFYNPMWSRLGREEPDAPGTFYFRDTTKPFNIFWHHLDQVLVRPALLDSLPDEEFRILTSIPGPDGSPINLIRSTGKHWVLKYSDHLPIRFKIDPPEGPDHA